MNTQERAVMQQALDALEATKSATTSLMQVPDAIYSLCQALTAPTLPMVALLSDARLDAFAERIRADEREHCAAIAEQMTAHSRKTRAVLIGVVAPDCPVAAAIRNL